MYFFSNSPVKWRLTKVVCGGAVSNLLSQSLSIAQAVSINGLLSRTALQKVTYLSGTTITDKHELEGWD
jgi:hypothetical protein